MTTCTWAGGGSRRPPTSMPTYPSDTRDRPSSSALCGGPPCCPCSGRRSTAGRGPTARRCRSSSSRGTVRCMPSTRWRTTAERPGPTFSIRAHPAPHPPYIFNADGSFLDATPPSTGPERINYVEQLQYTNRRVLQAIDRLMAHDPDEPDPIIILQADEGPFPAAFSANERGFQWLDASPREIQQKFGILNAVRLPGRPRQPRIQRREQPGQPVPDGVQRLLRSRSAVAAERDLPVAGLLADVGFRAVPAPRIP